MNFGNTLILDAFWVSSKPFPTTLMANSQEGRPFYDYYTEGARFVGWMDFCLLKQIIQKHHITHIILRNLNTLRKISSILGKTKVCIAYEYKKFFIIHSISKKKELVHCKPIYQDVIIGGWDFEDDATEIPSRAQQYMRFLLIHSRVNSITCMTNKIKLTAYFDDVGRIDFKYEPN